MRSMRWTVLAGLAMLGLAMLGLAMTGCDNGTDADPVEPGALVGKWNITFMHDKGWTKTTMPGEDPVTETVDDTITPPSGSFVEFKQDGTFILNTSFEFDGTWSVKDGVIVTVVDFLGISDTSEYEATIDGSNGTFVTRDVSSEDFDGVVEERDVVSTIKATKE